MAESKLQSGRVCGEMCNFQMSMAWFTVASWRMRCYNHPRAYMSLFRFSHMLSLSLLLAAGAGGVWLWNYVDDMTAPLLVPVNPSYTGVASVPSKAPGLHLEPFSFTGWDGGAVPAVIVTRAKSAPGEQQEATSRQLAITAELATRRADRLGVIDYVLLSVDWDHGIRSALPLAESLTAAGLSCVLWEPRGENSRRPYCTHGLRECRDIPLLINALSARSGKENPVVVGMGQGYGAALMLQAAAHEPRLRGLVAIDSFASLSESLGRMMPPSAIAAPLTAWLMDRRINRKVGYECFDVAPVESAAGIGRNVPALIINLAQDNPVSTLDDALTIYRRLRSDCRDVWTVRSSSDPAAATGRNLFFSGVGSAEKRHQEQVRVGLVQDAESAVADVLHWLNDRVVDAVESPHVFEPARPLLTADSYH